MNNVLTFVTAFKKFKGPYEVVQKSALYTYKMNDIDVVAPDNEVALKENCPGVTFIDGVKRARELDFNHQSPVLCDLLKKALPIITTPMIGFIKSDVLLPEDFLLKCNHFFDQYGLDVCLAGARHNIKLVYGIVNSESFKRVQQEKWVESGNMDFFITSKFIWKKILKDMPEFILGRFYWDRWLLGAAEKYCPKRYNCTDSLIALHCDHNYNHIILSEKAATVDAVSSLHNKTLWEKSGLSGDLKGWKKV